MLKAPVNRMNKASKEMNNSARKRGYTVEMRKNSVRHQFGREGNKGFYSFLAGENKESLCVATMVAKWCQVAVACCENAMQRHLACDALGAGVMARRRQSCAADMWAMAVSPSEDAKR